MAKKVKELPPSAMGTGGLYPWDEWLDGSAWELRQGEDFSVSVSSMKSQATIRAKKRGLGLHTRERGKLLYVQAIHGVEANNGETK